MSVRCCCLFLSILCSLFFISLLFVLFDYFVLFCLVGIIVKEYRRSSKMSLVGQWTVLVDGLIVFYDDNRTPKMRKEASSEERVNSPINQNR